MIVEKRRKKKKVEIDQKQEDKPHGKQMCRDMYKVHT